MTKKRTRDLDKETLYACVLRLVKAGDAEDIHKGRYYQAALEISQMGLSQKHINYFVRLFLVKYKSGIPFLTWPMLDWAISFAKIGASKDVIRLVLKTLTETRSHRTYSAEELAQILGRKLTKKEISNMIRTHADNMGVLDKLEEEKIINLAGRHGGVEMAQMAKRTFERKTKRWNKGADF